MTEQQRIELVALKNEAQIYIDKKFGNDWLFVSKFTKRILDINLVEENCVNKNIIYLIKNITIDFRNEINDTDINYGSYYDEIDDKERIDLRSVGYFREIHNLITILTTKYDINNIAQEENEKIQAIAGENRRRSFVRQKAKNNPGALIKSHHTLSSKIFDDDDLPLYLYHDDGVNIGITNEDLKRIVKKSKQNKSIFSRFKSAYQAFFS